MSGYVRTAKKQAADSWLSDHWIKLFLLVYGVWVGLPFLAPVFMQIGLTGPAKVLYFIYSFFCHQLPERSLFFFGQKSMYSLGEIQFVWQDTINPLILRKFIGTPEMGWKMAWSDRMISFYGGIWLFGLLWWGVRRRLRQLRWWVFVLLILPIFLDAGTHTISDLAGIGQGFRDSNTWLAALTDHSFPPGFYAGDALGSFNSWMRLVTGVLAAAGIVGYGFYFIDNALALPRKLQTLKDEYTRVSDLSAAVGQLDPVFRSRLEQRNRAAHPMDAVTPADWSPGGEKDAFER